MFACKGGHLDTVLTLLDYNSNTVIKNRVGWHTFSGDYVHVHVICLQDGMTAADVASINLHSDVHSVLQLMSPHDTAATEEPEVSLHSKLCGTIVIILPVE